jgi:L-alanine-DL-glutamate epimerase-like enolase superfamily enzyme
MLTSLAMKPALRVRAVEIHRLAIPMRLAFEHAAATRSLADPLVVCLSGEAPYAGHAGYGETLARPYVTGESAETVVQDIEQVLVPRLVEFRAESFAQAVEFSDSLPTQVDGRLIHAARTAVELAVLDLAGRVFRRRVAEVAGWLDLRGFASPGCLGAVRYSGVVVGRTRARLTWLLRAQRCYGLRDFKIKVAVDGWQRRLEWAHSVLRDALRCGRATLRADANGGWSLSEARRALPALEACGVGALEQPLAPADDGQLAELARPQGCELIADESLVTLADAQRLIEQGAVRVFNVRLAKVGGLLPALRMAHLALSAGRDVQLGCLVGETSLLSAAGAAFLEVCPRVRFAEGAFGGWLLRDEVTREPVRFGYGGRLARRAGAGLGVGVDTAALRRLAAAPAKGIPL